MITLLFSLILSPSAYAKPNPEKSAVKAKSSVSARAPASLDLCNQPIKNLCTPEKGERYQNLRYDFTQQIFKTPKMLSRAELTQKIGAYQKVGADSAEGKQKYAELQSLIKPQLAKISALQKKILAQYNIDLADLKKRIQQITGVAVVTMDDLMSTNENEAPNTRLKNQFNIFLLTGFDGMTMNAVYYSQQKLIIISPGFLLRAFANAASPMDALRFVINHEKGHQIYDQNKTPAAQNLLTCINQTFISDPKQGFADLTQTRDQLKQGVPALRKQIDALPLSTNAFQIRELESVYQSTDEYLKSLAAPVARTKVDLVKNELLADEVATHDLASRLVTIEPADRAQAVADELNFLCPYPTAELAHETVWGNLNEPTHPPDPYRIESVLRNPAIRQALGCAPLAKEAYCTLQK